jgi:hypothetical protein
VVICTVTRAVPITMFLWIWSPQDRRIIIWLLSMSCSAFVSEVIFKPWKLLGFDFCPTKQVSERIQLLGSISYCQICLLAQCLHSVLRGPSE